MARFRKKPVVIEAVRWMGDNLAEMTRHCAPLGQGEGWQIGRLIFDMPIPIKTLEGEMKADVGDWVIRGVKGELYPCKPDIFEATYEPEAHGRYSRDGTMDDQLERYRQAFDAEPWHEADKRRAWAIVGYYLGLMVVIGIAIAAGIGLAWLLVRPAAAQGMTTCLPLSAWEKQLKADFQEDRIGFGIVNQSAVVLFFATPSGSTWTALAVNPQGIACLLSSGTDLEIAPTKQGRES